MATHMRQKLPESKWEITIIDQDWQHHYQPGWIFISSGRGWGWPWNSSGPWGG